LRGDARQRKEIIEREIPVADGVETVRRDAGKTKFLRQRTHDQSGTSNPQALPIHRARIRARRRILQSRLIAREGFPHEPSEMRKQNGLGVLHVGHARHRIFRFALRQQQKTR